MIPLFDAYAGFGGHKPAARRAVRPEELSTEMARLTIGRALVRIAPEELDSDFESSNETLLRACAQFEGLVPCPVVIPNTAGDARPEDEQVETLLTRGAGAVCLRPKRDHWILSEWVSGALFRALQARKVPVFCKEEQVPFQQVAKLAGRYPELPIILAETGYRSQRVVLPLLKTFANVHLSTGGAFSVHRGIEQLAREVGAERVLFGTGFPEAEPMAAVAQLTYAEIPDRQRELIGSGNVERLVGGIRR